MARIPGATFWAAFTVNSVAALGATNGKSKSRAGVLEIHPAL